MTSRLLIFLAIVLCSCSPNKPVTVPKPDVDNGGLFLPDGFGALIVADSVGPSRHIAVNDNGDIYVKLRITTGDLYDLVAGNAALRDTDGDGKVDIKERFGSYPNDGAFGTEMRIHNGHLYFSTEQVVYRQKLTSGELVPTSKPEILFVDHHPLQWHNAKSLAFDGKGGMYITFSTPTNVCEDWSTVPPDSLAGVKGEMPCAQLDDQAGIWRFSESKLQQRQWDGVRYATGIRSVVAMTWNDDDNSLYAVQHGRDYLYGHAPKNYTPWDNAVLPAEEFMKISDGDNYGWPYSYYDHFKGKRMMAPEYGGDGKKESTNFTSPLMGLPAHWAPNDMLFYKGNQFPERYKQGAFIAFHGSTNRAPYPQAGYIVSFVPFVDGKPTGTWEVFADGFTGVDTVKSMPQARFRPMGLAEGPDGSLYISESKQGRIWRVMFTGDVKTFNDSNLRTMEARKERSYIATPEKD